MKKTIYDKLVSTKREFRIRSIRSKLSEQRSCVVKDERYTNGEYSAYFPSFYPDGDYYFFIEENFEFGYLGHPWRQEIWIFGRDLIKEIEQVYLELGWKKLN